MSATCEDLSSKFQVDQLVLWNLCNRIRPGCMRFVGLYHGEKSIIGLNVLGERFDESCVGRKDSRRWDGSQLVQIGSQGSEIFKQG